ncbi:MAG: NAD/NADP octopine/nopaline dehydrogenase family protein [Firmicutes bacterium]|nr:NAD/NADP octopine/nopaline dehydrogenase family protein [Bacillota bacterium]
MKVAVLGSGNGGHAIAFEFAQAGHDVYMFDFPQFSKSINAIAAKGGIESEGELSGFQKITYAGSDIETVIKGAEMVFVVGPAYSTAAFAEACKPHIEKGQMYIICPSSCAGSLVFKNALGLGVDDETIIVGETNTLPYAVRITGEAHITVYNRLKGGWFIAALPSKYNDLVFEKVGAVLETVELGKNVMQTSLQNANPIIHPSVSLCNVARIESPDDFLFYEEGVTEGVGRVIKALDDERIAIGKALGVTVIPDPELGIRQGYQAVNSYDIGYSQAPGFKGILAQTTLDYRYFNEDAGYGLVFLTSLGDQIGVPTPNMKAILRASSIVTGRNYEEERARDMAALGLEKYSLEELKVLL